MKHHLHRLPVWRRPIAVGMLLLFSVALGRGPAQTAESLPLEADPSVPPAAVRTEHGDMVQIGRNIELPAGQTAKDLVVVGGSALVRGIVRGDAVAVGGKVTVEGNVNRDVVAVLGDVELRPNARVGGDIVAVLGSVKLSPNTSVRGDVVTAGGEVDRAETATVNGDVVPLPVPGLGALRDWLVHSGFKLRLLSPQVGWVWAVAGGFFLLYVLVTIAFPRPVAACVEELTRRPATTFLIGLLTKLLVPIITLILVVTGIGIVIVPFLFAAVLVAAIIGKVALLQYLGRQLGAQFGATRLPPPLLALLIGSVLVTVLYLVPILGMLVYGVTGLWAIGAATLALFGRTRREQPERPAAPPVPPPPAATATGSAVAAAAVASTAAATDAAQPRDTPSLTPGPAAATEALVFPRAQFWERMAAAFLDVILVSILGAVVGGPPLGLLVALAYFAGMWAWKGTTIGGIVLNLKVVRLDDQPVTFAVALVRGLAAAFSVIVMFLGFLWMVWDKDHQTWHDKIAGTVVIRLPRGTSLVCL